MPVLKEKICDNKSETFLSTTTGLARINTSMFRTEDVHVDSQSSPCTSARASLIATSFLLRSAHSYISCSCPELFG